MNKDTIIITAIICLSIIFSVLIYSLIQKDISYKELMDRELQRRATLEQRSACLSQAYQNYSREWNLKVRQLGSKDNLLPGFIKDKLDTEHRIEQELCIKKYPL